MMALTRVGRLLLFALSISPLTSIQSIAQTAVADIKELAGTWDWFTNPNDSQHRWGGFLYFDLLEGGGGKFTGRQTGDESRIEGSLSPTGVSWTRYVPPDSTGSATQTWTARLTHGTDTQGRPTIIMEGRWSGAWATDAKANGSDFDFKAVKHGAPG
jgi:hypothetical protein